eukprot:CAMPEP_0179983006 /NCGR_PEP_ID=MMETSP0984-20121128/298_1 /TAXON_ID=483367 /ORGANISM="non described non described, Strain CCMP 2436" /LENGTH=60 /DNA_ID=CAMNT_0021901355 /DNA_START=108 /DNA_END=287 /DNA_ORIENTATION=+
MSRARLTGMPGTLWRQAVHGIPVAAPHMPAISTTVASISLTCVAAAHRLVLAAAAQREEA